MYWLFKAPELFNAIKTNQAKMKNWNIISYSLSNTILSKQSLTFYTNSFWSDIFNNLDDNQFITLYIVVEYKDNQMKALGKASKVNKNDLNFEKTK